MVTNIPLEETSLFRNIALEQIARLTIDLLCADLKISREYLQKLLQFITSQTSFPFNGNMYDHVDGFATGSPLAPILAKNFMGYHENRWIKYYNYRGLLYYKRHADDIFLVFETKDHAVFCYNYINRQHSNIKFKHENRKTRHSIF